MQFVKLFLCQKKQTTEVQTMFIYAIFLYVFNFVH